MTSNRTPPSLGKIRKMPEAKYIFDTVSISNFALAGALDLIVRRYSGNAFVTSEVHNEIRITGTVGILKAAVSAEHLSLS